VVCHLILISSYLILYLLEENVMFTRFLQCASGEPAALGHVHAQRDAEEQQREV
jgi:hypothetical protein